MGESGARTILLDLARSTGRITRHGLIVHGWHDATLRRSDRRSKYSTGGGAGLRRDGRGAHRDRELNKRAEEKPYH
eukprot:3828020-Prymnesium_polylepis.1